MPEITQEAIDRLKAEAPASTLSDSAALGVLFLEREFGLPRPQALTQISPAPGEQGVDGFHVDAEKRNAWLFQFRWTEARACFELPLQQLVDGGLARIAGVDPPGVAPDQFLMQVRGPLMAAQSVIERVFIQLIFRGDPTQAERSLVYGRLREELENRKHLLDAFFGRPVTLAFEFRSVADGSVGGQVHLRQTHTYALGMDASIVRHGPAGEVVRVGFARLADLHAMYRAMGQRFFETNIRSILADDTPTNRSLFRAFSEILLDGNHDPLEYAFDHNGATLFAERVEEKGGALVLTEPRLLNGAQTIATLHRFLTLYEHDARLAAHAKALGELAILCKIITDARTEFVLRVTLNNNRQNPVKPWNLHANDLIQLELQDKFREETGLYYERQERAFAALEDEEDAPPEGEAPPRERKAIELVKLAQTFLAADGNLEQLARLSEVFEREDQYAKVFSPARLKADARRIVLCYKVQLRLTRVIKEILERGERKYAWARRARSLIWALLIQGVLNDPELDAHAQAWGTKLTFEPGLVDHLTALAGSKVRLLLGSIVVERHALELEQERFGFLRTNAVAAACLALARERFGWTKKAL